MHEMPKKNVNELEGDNAAMVSHQGKGGNLSWYKDVKMCYYCGKLGHIAHVCYKTINKDKGNADNTKTNNDYTFVMQHETQSDIICKWIMDLGTMKHMTFYRVAFDTYKVIAPCKCLFGWW